MVKERNQALDGILNVNKPAGLTSYGVIARIKRLSSEKHVGHAGTLDPDATGVLPVCLGKATRIVEYLSEASKTYCACIALGTTTDTYDAGGKVLQQSDASGIDRAKLESALSSFRGTVQQTPPMYSALKHNGEPLYKLARAGISIERKSRDITIYRLEITEWQPPLVTIEVECSKGTYIRSLAHDLGQTLGCGAHLKTLVRTAYGPFDIKTAVTLTQLDEAFHEGQFESFLRPIDCVLQNYRAVVIDEAAQKAMKQGNLLILEQADIEDKTATVLCRAYATDGHFMGVLRYIPDKAAWQPEKVFIQG
jgi:tRNA pseudouridine55 synthase